MLRLFARAALAVALASAVTPARRAQQPAARPRPDLGEFTKEIMAVHFDGGQQHLAVWTPYEFFLAASTLGGKHTQEEIERDLGFLRSYVIILVSAAIPRPDGSETYATEADVRRRAVLKLSDGAEVMPLAEVPPRVAAIVGAMRSFMSAQGGADRENMQVVVFPATVAPGKTVVDTARKDTVTLVLKADARFHENTFTWRTPFDATLNVPPCPKCKAPMSAKWSYCPYDGTKLP
ncbi:MAG TPA: zinc ribbon domain-containing protein [Pyrinomonadaceae bacterium]|jgi:hypothetical protein|nr:zinc ribbon domain-containing protein [Pyrinomonadaceae bacterium]